MGSALRAATSGFYYNSWRLVGANVIWGALLLITGGLVLIAPGWALLAFMLVLPLPTAALFRVAGMIVRGEPVALSDALRWRSVATRATTTGILITLTSLVLIFNTWVGLNTFDPIGWAAATAAFWGLVILWLVAAAVWPLLFDPLRANEPATRLLRLGVVVILVKPLRFLLLALTLAVFLIISTILAAALLTVSMAFVALTLAAYTIPAADRIEGRRTFVVIS